jgi:hypothetical protein
MLLCGIINEMSHLTKLRDEEATTLLSYFFCQATDMRINNATAVLRGLIYLLVKQRQSLISHIQKYDQGAEKPFEGENAWWALSNIFNSIIQDPSLQNTYLIVDALDECVTDLPLLLALIVKNSSTSTRVKWIVSSRNWPVIEEHLDSAIQKVNLCLELNNKSISAAVSTYIKYKVNQLAQMKRFNHKTRDAVENHLSLNANNTFLWVALACRELELVNKRNVLDVLQEMPPGLEPLYDRMLSQIQRLQHEDRENCRLVLSTMTLATNRPLRLLELGALSGLPGQISSNPNDVMEVVNTCGSFLTVREDRVYFIHPTANVFLLRKAFDKVFPFDKAEVNEGLPSLEPNGSKEGIEPRVKPHGHRGEFYDPTETATDGGYRSMASKQLLEGESNESDTKSIDSLESHITSASALNPAGVGGAAEELAKILLDNEEIQQCVKRGFMAMDSDRFERNFIRLLKSYASELRAEADTHIQKGAARIVHSYRAYVTRIIQRRVLGLDEDDSQATAFHGIKDQTGTKLALERFLVQPQSTETADQGDTRPEDEQESNEDSHSDDEDSYLPNLEKLTDFLVLSTAFKNFKVRLEALVKSKSLQTLEDSSSRVGESDGHVPIEQPKDPGFGRHFERLDAGDDSEAESDISDVLSLFSTTDSLAPSDSSYGSMQAYHTNAAEQLAAELLKENELKSLYEAALAKFGKARFAKNHDILLKELLIALRLGATGHQLQAVRMLRGKYPRSRVTTRIVGLLEPTNLAREQAMQDFQKLEADRQYSLNQLLKLPSAGKRNECYKE